MKRRRRRRVLIAGDFNARSELWVAGELNERSERVEEFVMADCLEVMNERSEWTTFEDTRGRSPNIGITLVTGNMFFYQDFKLPTQESFWVAERPLLAAATDIELCLDPQSCADGHLWPPVRSSYTAHNHGWQE
ncbi:hypothetical protein J6590_066358 [Homalodisca vitripennis]|nr:hypothetical protein J6590_066358 [Homalodisca vitripennis]